MHPIRVQWASLSDWIISNDVQYKVSASEQAIDATHVTHCSKEAPIAPREKDEQAIEWTDAARSHRL